jgi:xanthine dehydrogenase YagR molybdenum-binding subunit
VSAVPVELTSPVRVEGPLKVSGAARYAFEHSLDEMAYAWGIQSTIAKGKIRSFDAGPALAMAGVLAVITPDNAPYLPGRDDLERTLFQSHEVAYRGQFVGAVVATSLEVAREAAAEVQIDYAPETHDVILTADHPKHAPDHVNPNYQTDTAKGDFAAAFDAARVRIDQTHETPAQHNNPMEPHATIAWWDGEQLTLIDSTQGPSRTKALVAGVFGLDPSQVRVIAHHIGGGFGAN